MTKKVWDITNLIEELDPKKGGTTEAQRGGPSFDSAEKNPALAATLSIFLWGGGQIYNNNIRTGLILALSMIGSWGTFYLLLTNWSAIFDYLKGIGLTPINIILLFLFLYIIVMLVWFGNIISAYWQAEKRRSKPFNGTEHPLLSGIASTLIPGWGQIINGQPKKGAIYLFSFFVGLFCLTVIISSTVLWPSIDMEHEMSTFETILLVSLILIFIASLLWIINVFDAILVAFEPVKKESMGKRLRYSINRIKSRRNQIELWQRMKVTFFLILLLIFSVAISYSVFPKEYYYNTLTSLSRDLNKNGMKVLPAFIQDTADAIFHKKQKQHNPEKNSI
ncbi:MAG: hypothetical protein AABY79_11105 [Nitrospirota bacterium]|jgi:TM2 domain-containing membrane protein YozV